jgi:hypothetical protein
MNLRLERLRLAFASAAVLALAACGGGGDNAAAPVAAAPPPAPAPAPAPTTTNVSTTVVDGAIKNAVVCLDKNGNGQCDADETKGTTDAAGQVTLAVPNADVGKYPLLAVIGTDAVDADNGPVTTRYTLSAPADQVAIVSPLTTLVQQTVATNGVTSAEAAKSVQDATGITASLFTDFSKATPPTDGSVNAATVARMLVLATQRQANAVASALGTPAIDGATITQADLDKAIQKKLLELLNDLVTALSDPTVAAAATPAAKEAALLAAATTLVSGSGLTPASVAVAVAVNTQAAAPEPTTPRVAAASISLDALSFTDAANYYMRSFGSSLAQDTPDTANKVRYVERRHRAAAGHVAAWGSGSDPWRSSDVSWNGSAWTTCPINFENVNSVRDANGTSSYTYCDGRETGKSVRATFDIAGKTLAEVYAQIVAAGYSNLYIANPSTLGSAVFPAESKLSYQTNTALTESFAYLPGGTDSPAGFSNVVSQYSAGVSAGGTAAAQPAGTLCNSTETQGNGANSTTLEGMIASKTGTPCVFAQGTFVYAGVTYTSDAVNEWWGNSTVGLGKLGSVPLNTGTAPGYYSGNTLLRVAFAGGGTNPVTYYACKERFNNGSPRNCTAIGSGSYAITTLGDARVLTLTNPPLQAAPLNYNRVFVERNGLVYYGYQSKLAVTSKARLNTTATNALLTQLGVPMDDPAVPLALTATSYQGTWDFRNTGTAISPTNGTTVFINGNGSSSCQDRSDASFYACTVTITDPATGAFTLTDAVSSASGTLSFAAGTGSGTYHDPTTTPTDGTFIGGRR